MKIVIRVNGSPEIGMGHFVRCHTMAKAFLEAKQEVVIRVNEGDRCYCKSEIPQLIEYVSDEDYGCEADLLIADMYCYDNEYYDKIRNHYRKIIIFDDNRFEIPKSVDGVINNNLYASEELYPKGKKIFAGSRYYLLRNSFKGKRKSQTANSIFVCMGGSDPEDQLSRIIPLLLLYTKRSINAVFGYSDIPSEIQALSGLYPQLRLWRQVAEPAGLMQDAAYAICGAGSMVYELAYLQVPFACVALADNQRTLAEALCQKEATCYLGYYRDYDEEQWRLQLQKMESESYRRALAAAAIQVCSNEAAGAAKLVEDLMKWVMQDGQ